MEKRLGRDAPHVEAGPSEGAAPLDAGHLEAELGALDGGDVAARPAADDDDILLLVSDGPHSVLYTSYLIPVYFIPLAGCCS